MSSAPDALIGYTGFVGGNLARQRRFDALYNRQNIDEMRGRPYGTVYCAAAPGTKWLANKRPRDDWRAISLLWEVLATVDAERFVLISTVDVFANPRDVDEGSRATTEGLHWYGINRLNLEVRVAGRFGRRAMIVRLPALFGRGLKKNALFDLMAGRRLGNIMPGDRYQWRPLDGLAETIDAAADCGLPLLHLVSEPISMGAVRDRFFAGARIGRAKRRAVDYCVRTRYPQFKLTGPEVERSMEAYLAGNA